MLLAAQTKVIGTTTIRVNTDSNFYDPVRADEFSMRASSSLAVSTLSRWKRACMDVQSKEQIADAFHATHTAIVVLTQWRKRLRRKARAMKAAKAAQQYFVMRRAWLLWIEKVEERRREQLLRVFLRNKKKRAFESKSALRRLDPMLMLFSAWLHRTRVVMDRNAASQEMQSRIARRILTSSLAKWKERVIVIRARWYDVDQNAKMIDMV